jgi:hypothetical protein
MARNRRFAESYYVKDGEPTSEQESLQQALRPVKRLYANTPAKDCGLLALKAVRPGIGEASHHPNDQDNGPGYGRSARGGKTARRWLNAEN